MIAKTKNEIKELDIKSIFSCKLNFLNFHLDYNNYLEL